MRHSSWCTGRAWLGLQEKCTETAKPQSSQRHHLASHEACTDSRSQRTSWSDQAARWEASRWHHHSPLVERQAISLGRCGARYIRWLSCRQHSQRSGSSSQSCSEQQEHQVQTAIQHSCVRSGGHWDRGYMAPSGGGTGTGDWKTDGQHYRRCQGVQLPVPAEGECGLISKHVHRQLARCNPFFHFLNVLVHTGFVLMGQKIIIHIHIHIFV